ncbi:hypothetical protein GVK07_15330, partial [Listeria monocytogenes]|nr:hypothetical protein [Listeria monocytogenes]
MGVKYVEIEKIDNYIENPRHEVGLNELDTLKKLFDVSGYQNMINLAQDIYTNGLVNASLVTIVKLNNADRYTVYEGNRRVACIKLILHPEKFSFLPKNQIDRIKKMKSDTPSKINLSQIECLITDEEDAFFIMRRIHSGEDKGRGLKSWNTKEQEIFKLRTNPKNSTSIAKIISDKYEEFFKEDIQEEMAYTNIQRLFNNLEVRESLGIEKDNIDYFSCERLYLIKGVIEKVNQIAKIENLSISRKFNKRKIIEQIVIPIIEELKSKQLESKAINSIHIEQKNKSNKLSNSKEQQTQNKEATSNNGISVREDTGLKTEYKSIESISSTLKPKLPPKIGSGKLLSSTMPFTNLYHSNVRINTLVIEINQIRYKDFRLATQFLLRSLMEVY